MLLCEDTQQFFKSIERLGAKRSTNINNLFSALVQLQSNYEAAAPSKALQVTIISDFEDPMDLSILTHKSQKMSVQCINLGRSNLTKIFHDYDLWVQKDAKMQFDSDFEAMKIDDDEFSAPSNKNPMNLGSKPQKVSLLSKTASTAISIASTSKKRKRSHLLEREYECPLTLAELPYTHWQPMLKKRKTVVSKLV